VHQSRFAGAIVADKAEAFPSVAGKIHVVESMDGAETLFDAVQSNNRIAFAVHCPEVAFSSSPAQGAGDGGADILHRYATLTRPRIKSGVTLSQRDASGEGKEFYFLAASTTF